MKHIGIEIIIYDASGLSKIVNVVTKEYKYVDGLRMYEKKGDTEVFED